MIVTEFDGVYFYENHPQGATVIEPVSVAIDGVFKNAQLCSLDDVKAKLASICREKGGNAIVNFSYGQKSAGFFASLFSLDNVSWYGKGSIAIV